MPSVYDFHHIELDRIGRGKKRSMSIASSEGGMKLVLKSGDCSTASSASSLCSGSGVSGGKCAGTSGSGSPRSCSSSPLSERSLPSLSWTPASSRPASRRGSRCEDTKNRLFGAPPPAQPATNRRSVNNLQHSKVFDTTDAAVVWTKIAATKAAATYTPVRRNPITGEIMSIQPKVVAANALKKPAVIQSLPVTPTFNRQSSAAVKSAGDVIGKVAKNLAADHSSISSSWLSINSSSSAPSN